MKILLIALLTIAGTLLTLCADIVLKKSELHDWRYISAGIVLYALVAIPVVFAFKYSQFGSLILFWEAVSVILSVLVAYKYFGEPITSYRLLSLALALGAIIFAYK